MKQPKRSGVRRSQSRKKGNANKKTGLLRRYTPRNDGYGRIASCFTLTGSQ
ncbi:MAG: hypothetical protein LBH30_04785 [Prevotellaceae bacterium]|nr:hypothetical protein [Prevotellaceae bacterium]